jgi:hypothetical protein
MRCVANLDHACTGRCPAGLRVAPEQFEVNDGVWWCALDELLENGRPFHLLHSRHVFHTLEHLFLLNGVVPAFLLGTGDLLSLAKCRR